MDRLERVKAIVKQYANKGEILLEESYANGEHASTTGYWDGYTDCAKLLLKEIDSLQEEPASIDFEQELYKAFGQVKDFTLGMRIAKWFYDMGKNSKDSQEPVSEDLEEAAIYYADTHTEWFDADNNPHVSPAFKAGAKWQKEQFENNCLKHCNSITNEQAELEQDFVDQHLDKHQRIPTFLDAIEYGMNLQKEQMIKNAVDGVVAASAGGEGLVNIATGFVKSEDVNVKFGDKIKIIVVKED